MFVLCVFHAEVVWGLLVTKDPDPSETPARFSSQYRRPSSLADHPFGMGLLWLPTLRPAIAPGAGGVWESIEMPQRIPPGPLGTPWKVPEANQLGAWERSHPRKTVARLSTKDTCAAHSCHQSPCKCPPLLTLLPAELSLLWGTWEQSTETLSLVPDSSGDHGRPGQQLRENTPISEGLQRGLQTALINPKEDLAQVPRAPGTCQRWPPLGCPKGGGKPGTCRPSSKPQAVPPGRVPAGFALAT